MYNVIEYGTNRILASYCGVEWMGINAWCAENGYMPHHKINARNWVVIK